ncbi:S-layer homology domain-containing protein [Paenibacillus sp. CF384]|uniref:S-layer homology domain-containing protein n=1 Tax=Paenibacillus sp. CF384 TaxID=1884382 RepID=UPI00089C728F|nr:S-layer homology domain-containing protein [Paenibacillus sp. CF384]SDW98110.1 S-layer homology domain-containing protein [Paenibacillus sp. CF384]
MKKKASKWLLLPLGVSLLVPGVAAHAESTTVKTSADFTDLAGLDAATKAKIDALLAKGVFEGQGTETFGIQDNMNRAQFAKVAALIFGLKVDTSVKTSSFSDVTTDFWAIPFIEAAKKAGLMDGVGDNKFAPSGTTNMGQLATVFVRGLGGKVDVTKTPWYSDAITQAIDKKILPAGVDGSKLATRQDLVIGAYGGQQAFEEIKKAQEEANKPTPPTTPVYGGGDTTAPSITAATVNGRNVTVTGGVNGSISFKSSAYLTEGTLSVSEASTLTITAIEGITLTDYPSLSLTQSLASGSNTLDLIDKLGALDPQEDGVSVSLLKQLDTNHDGLVVTGTLRDGSSNSSTVTLTIKADDAAPNLTAANVNSLPVDLDGNDGTITITSGYLTAGDITSNEDATLTITSIQNVNLASYPSLSFTQQLVGGTASSLNLITKLGALDAQGDGVSVSYLKQLGGNNNQLVVTGTLTDAAGNSSAVTLTFYWNNIA